MWRMQLRLLQTSPVAPHASGEVEGETKCLTNCWYEQCNYILTQLMLHTMM